MTGPDPRGLLDTSTVILLGRLASPTVLPDESVVNATTLGELSIGPHMARAARERVVRPAHPQQAGKTSKILLSK